MSAMKKSAVALALASVVTAQTTSSVVSLFFPDSEGQELLGSIIATNGDATTLAVACNPSATATDCYLDQALTVTVGPSTFHVQEELDGVTVALDCVVDGSTAATCAQTYIGPGDVFETGLETASVTDDSQATNTGITTSTTTTILAQSEIDFIPITLVADLEAAAAATTGASGTASTASETGSGSSSRTSGGSSTASQTSSATRSSSSSASASASATGSSNAATRADVSSLAFSAVGAALLGLTAYIL